LRATLWSQRLCEQLHGFADGPRSVEEVVAVIESALG
jgi:hypothetical protein